MTDTAVAFKFGRFEDAMAVFALLLPFRTLVSQVLLHLLTRDLYKLAGVTGDILLWANITVVSEITGAEGWAVALVRAVH